MLTILSNKITTLKKKDRKQIKTEKLSPLSHASYNNNLLQK